MARVGEGSEEAFRVLYRCHTPALLALARRLVGDPADAEEAVQEAWIRAVRALPGFRWRSAFGTWLTGIAVNCCRELGRRRRAEASNLAEQPDPSSPGMPSPGQGLDLERALGRLSHPAREVLVLHDVEGFTHGEIAGLLGIEPGTSKSRLSRARQSLRAWIRGAETP